MSHRIRRVSQLRVAPAPLVRRYGLLAERLEVRTNDPRVLAAADAAFGRFSLPVAGTPLALRLVVRGPDVPGERRPPDLPDTDRIPGIHRLRYDTAGHLFSIELGAANRAMVDVAHGFATGGVSPALADDGELLRSAFVEAMALAMLTGGRGYVPVHASCVVRDGVGVILQAPAGTGKSTLAFACARRGLGLLAEDVVFARPIDGPGGVGPLELWGMPWIQRLLPDAARFFPELAGRTARRQWSGEQKLEVDLDAHAPGAGTPRAAAGPVVLLTRGAGGPTRADWLSPDEDPADIEVLWPWEAGWTPEHDRTAARLLDHGVVRLRMNGTPEEAADALEQALSAGPAGAAARTRG